MISGAYYETVYLVILTLITLFQSNRYLTANSKLLDCRPQDGLIAPLLLILFLTFWIGLRPNWFGFTDSRNYIRVIEYLEGSPFEFRFETDNILFDNLLTWFACNNLGWSNFFLVIASIYFGGILVACRKMFPRDTMYAVLIYLAAFSTFSYATNGIKAGAAASLFLVALAYRNKRWISYLFVALSYGFHHSMLVPIVAYVLVSLIKNPKYYLLVWCGALLMSALHITFFQVLFAGLADEQGAGYLAFDQNDETLYLTGFRFDFIIYSAMPVILGYYLIFKKRLQSESYNFIYNLYVLVNSVWLLCMYASYTNRIAYLSWLLLPIVLIYPFLNERVSPSQYKVVASIALLHLGFTLFMKFVYY